MDVLVGAALFDLGTLAQRVLVAAREWLLGQQHEAARPQAPGTRTTFASAESSVIEAASCSQASSPSTSAKMPYVAEAFVR